MDELSDIGALKRTREIEKRVSNKRQSHGSIQH